MAAPERDWTKLPSDLLGSIAERLPLVDYIRFGAVSTSWASTLSLSTTGDDGGRRRLYRPNATSQSPWLMLPGEHREFSDTCTLFSVSDHKYYKLSSLPELRGKWWVSSNDGWVLTLDKISNLFLFNPLTRAQIRLPSATTLPGVQIIRSRKRYKYLWGGFFRGRREEFRRQCFCKVILSSSSSPTTTTTTTSTVNNNDYIAMAIVGHLDLVFTKAGDDKWTALESEKGHYEDAIYHKGKFYSLSFNADVRAWDLSGPSPVVTVVSKEIEGGHQGYKKYLVESSGDLLQVWRGSAIDFSTRRWITTEVIIFKFEPRGCEWIQVNSMGDRCMFLGLSHSMSLSTQDIPGLMPNCIYFTDLYWTGPFCNGNRSNIGIFNLEDRSFKPYHSSDFQFYWPSPVSIMPNLY